MEASSESDAIDKAHQVFAEFNLGVDELLAAYQAKIALKKYCKDNLKMEEQFMKEFLQMMDGIVDQQEKGFSQVELYDILNFAWEQHAAQNPSKPKPDLLSKELKKEVEKEENVRTRHEISASSEQFSADISEYQNKTESRTIPI